MKHRLPENFWINRIPPEQLPDLESTDADVNELMPWLPIPEAEDRNRPAHWTTSEQFDGHQFATYIPEQHEPNYTYPLLIWLHGENSSERELIPLMPKLSTRNYFALALRGDNPKPTSEYAGFGWKPLQDAIVNVTSRIEEALKHVEGQFQIHSDRIFIGGFDQGAELALAICLTQPDLFAGAISLCGKMPAEQSLLRRFRLLHGKRVLLVAGKQDQKVTLTDIQQTQKLLYTSGLDVSAQAFHAGHEISDDMLSSMNSWMMNGICTAV